MFYPTYIYAVCNFVYSIELQSSRIDIVSHIDIPWKWWNIHSNNGIAEISGKYCTLKKYTRIRYISIKYRNFRTLYKNICSFCVIMIAKLSVLTHREVNHFIDFITCHVTLIIPLYIRTILKDVSYVTCHRYWCHILWCILFGIWSIVEYVHTLLNMHIQKATLYINDHKSQNFRSLYDKYFDIHKSLKITSEDL